MCRSQSEAASSLEDEPSHTDHTPGVAAAFCERVARMTACEGWHGHGPATRRPRTSLRCRSQSQAASSFEDETAHTDHAPGVAAAF